MGTFRYGTSSWSEKGWVGPFYPKGTRPGDMLRVYSTRYDTVEADVTWYRIPDARLTLGWQEKTPDRFRLAAKFPRDIVHGGEGRRPDPSKVLLWEAVAPAVEEFLGAMRLLGDKCGPLVLQLPYFNRQVFSDQSTFLARLDSFLGRLPGEFRIAVEVRNKSWLNDALLSVLRRHGAALVLVDLVYMPHPTRLAEQMDLVTTDFCYCRLIGDRNATERLTKTFDAVVIDQSSRLQRWAEFLAELEKRVPETWVFANNHYAGYAPETLEELRSKVEEVIAARDGTKASD